MPHYVGEVNLEGEDTLWCFDEDVPANECSLVQGEGKLKEIKFSGRIVVKDDVDVDAQCRNFERQMNKITSEFDEMAVGDERIEWDFE